VSYSSAAETAQQAALPYQLYANNLLRSISAADEVVA